MKKLFWLLPLAALAGCATSTSGVAPMGDGQYLITGQDYTGWSSGEAKTALLREADDHCRKQGKELTDISLKGIEPNLIRIASAELKFRCK